MGLRISDVVDMLLTHKIRHGDIELREISLNEEQIYDIYEQKENFGDLALIYNLYGIVPFSKKSTLIEKFDDFKRKNNGID